MTQTLKPRHDERDVAGLEAARPVRTGENRPNGCPSILPAAVHAQVEWEAATAYADGYADGYARALHDVLTWPEATGEKPRTFKGTLKWLVNDINRNGVAA